MGNVILETGTPDSMCRGACLVVFVSLCAFAPAAGVSCPNFYDDLSASSYENGTWGQAFLQCVPTITSNINDWSGTSCTDECMAVYDHVMDYADANDQVDCTEARSFGLYAELFCIKDENDNLCTDLGEDAINSLTAKANDVIQLYTQDATERDASFDPNWQSSTDVTDKCDALNMCWKKSAAVMMRMMTMDDTTTNGIDYFLSFL